VYKVTTNPSGEGIYFHWYSVNNTKYNILMLKFTDNSGRIVSKTVEYSVKINKINGEEFRGNGSTNTGLDLQLINATTFSKNSQLNIKIDLTRFNEHVVNDYSKPKTTVVP
jgi:hypothetical protein